MFRITAVQMTAGSYSGKNWFAFEDWRNESFGIELPLPRKAFSISIFDDKRLPHSAVSATDARFGFVHFDFPDMPAPVTYRFVLFHRISVSAPLEWLGFGNTGRRIVASFRERSRAVECLSFPLRMWSL